jgi:riboflavin synthase
MFSGLIQALGKVEGRRGGILTLQAPKMKLKLGDSLAVNGVCLTVMKKAGEGRRLSFELSEETLARTTLGNLPAGTPVNIERTLTLADGLGGHLVQGHVDGTGTVVKIVPERGGMKTIWFKAPPEILKYIVSKGSVAIDGVSLTVANLKKPQFSVALIPFTLQHTNLGRLRVGQHVNLEADIIGKYVSNYIKK